MIKVLEQENLAEPKLYITTVKLKLNEILTIVIKTTRIVMTTASTGLNLK